MGRCIGFQVFGSLTDFRRHTGDDLLEAAARIALLQAAVVNDVVEQLAA